MISPVWYNIRRIDAGMYDLKGEHDVDIPWMKEIRGQDSTGAVVGRILPRFTVEGWDKTAYQELISNKEAGEELTRIILEQVTYLRPPPQLSLENRMYGLICRKYNYDGIVLEIAIPQYFESFLSTLADKLHSLPPGNKRIVVVIPPSTPGYPSSEVLSPLPSPSALSLQLIIDIV